jgi:hypothetical protein
MLLVADALSGGVRETSVRGGNPWRVTRSGKWTPENDQSSGRGYRSGFWVVRPKRVHPHGWRCMSQAGLRRSFGSSSLALSARSTAQMLPLLGRLQSSQLQQRPSKQPSERRPMPTPYDWARDRGPSNVTSAPVSQARPGPGSLVRTLVSSSCGIPPSFTGPWR